MNSGLLYLRARHIMGVSVGFLGAALLLLITRMDPIVWATLGGASFPVSIILPLGMACLVGAAEDSETRLSETLAARRLDHRHAAVSCAYLGAGVLIIVGCLGSAEVDVGVVYGAATAARNFLFLTGLAWLLVPWLGGLRACVVPVVVTGLSVTVLSGATAPPAWNVLLLGDGAPPVVTASVGIVLIIGLTVSVRASQYISSSPD